MICEVSEMKIILLTDVANLGKKNDVLEVNDGYAKNYLIKTKKAVVFSPTAVQRLKAELKDQETDYQEEIFQCKLLKQELENLELTFYLRSNHGNVFGHISSKELIDKINEHGKKVNKFMLTKDHEWDLGPHTVTLQLHKEVTANIKINVLEQK